MGFYWRYVFFDTIPVVIGTFEVFVGLSSQRDGLSLVVVCDTKQAEEWWEIGYNATYPQEEYKEISNGKEYHWD